MIFIVVPIVKASIQLVVTGAAPGAHADQKVSNSNPVQLYSKDVSPRLPSQSFQRSKKRWLASRDTFGLKPMQTSTSGWRHTWGQAEPGIRTSMKSSSSM
jgi:hypothetical protein